MNRFASLTEWLKDGKVIKVRSETITHPARKYPPRPEMKSTIPVATVEEITPEENAAIHKINEAVLGDLTVVKGIGPKTATKILDASPFTSFNHFHEQIKMRADIFDSLQNWANS